MADISAPTPQQELKPRSLPGIMTILVALGIIFIGLREFLQPGVAAQGFGVPLADPRDSDFLLSKPPATWPQASQL